MFFWWNLRNGDFNSTCPLLLSIFWWTVDHRIIIVSLFDKEMVLFHFIWEHDNLNLSKFKQNLVTCLGKVNLKLQYAGCFGQTVNEFWNIALNIAEFPSKEHLLWLQLWLVYLHVMITPVNAGFCFIVYNTIIVTCTCNYNTLLYLRCCLPLTLVTIIYINIE